MSDTPKILAMFPGQGSQYVGMAKHLLDEFPYTKTVFEEAEDIAKFSLTKLCLEGPEDQLKLTANTQPCIVATSTATWKVLREERGFYAAYFAGHSLGEYSALVAAGRLSFSDAISLVRARGTAMQKAVPEGQGAMSAVLSVGEEKLLKLCGEASTAKEPVEVVNFNSPQQLVVAGASAAVKRLEVALAAEGQKFVSLPVSAPFHSSLMSPARREMEPLLRSVKISSQDSFMIPNLSAEPTKSYDADFLIKQIDSPVRWTQSIEAANQQGVSEFVEIGPGKVLWGLARRILPKGAFKLNHTDVVKEFLAQS